MYSVEALIVFRVGGDNGLFITLDTEVLKLSFLNNVGLITLGTLNEF